MPTYLNIALLICVIIGITEIFSSFRKGNSLLGLGFILATVGTAWVWHTTALNWA